MESRLWHLELGTRRVMMETLSTPLAHPGRLPRGRWLLLKRYDLVGLRMCENPGGRCWVGARCADGVAKMPGDLAQVIWLSCGRPAGHGRGTSHVDLTQVHVDGDSGGSGYHAQSVSVGRVAARQVHTVMRFASLLADDPDGHFGDGDIATWHTGGQPAVFAAGGAPRP